MDQIALIKRLLENTGLHVYGVSDGNIVIEDPACITRGFEQFFNDAWIALVAITGFMIMIWGIAKIRGAKFSEMNYFKSLVMIFMVLSVMFPILNVIYGGDLFGIGCRKISVSLDEVKTLLSARTKGNVDALQYEDIDIYDSGPIYSTSEEPTPPDIEYLIEAADQPDEEESLQEH